MLDFFSVDFFIMAALACILLSPEDFVKIMSMCGKLLKQVRNYLEPDNAPILIERKTMAVWAFPYRDNQKSAFAQPI